MSMTISRSVQSSELSRNAREVFEAADKGPVIVTRRDGEDLVLDSRQNVEAERMGVELASHLVAASLAPGEAPFAERLLGAFPWAEFLSGEHREEFADEMVRVARACATVSRYERLLITLKAWQDSAEAIAAGWADAQVDWLDEDEDVPDPRASASAVRPSRGRKRGPSTPSSSRPNRQRLDGVTSALPSAARQQTPGTG